MIIKKKEGLMFMEQKVKLLEKLDSDVSVRHLTEEYCAGMPTTFDLKKKRINC